ncbi:alkaline phosphatase D family protein, partial [Xanthomonas citri pv. citri]
VWDDHEISNDTYKAGAENHQSNEGDWNQRKMDAMKAYHEWMPTRNSVMTQIYRSFDFGNLLSLHMLDTRVIARDKQLDYNNFLIKDANGQLTLDSAKFTAAMQDTSRQLIGLPQQNWLAGQLQASKSTWQILGQQVVMGQMFIPAPVLLNFM